MSKVITTESLDEYTGNCLTTAQAEAVVDAVNAWIETRTSRCWGETKQITEQYDYKRVVWLRHPDIVSIDEVTLGWPGHDQTTVPPESYYFNRRGRLVFISSLGSDGMSSPSYTQLSDYLGVKYTYGVEEVPGDLFHAALGIAAGFYNWAQENQKDIVATSAGSYSVQYAGARGSNVTPSPEANTLAALFATVKGYAVRHI